MNPKEQQLINDIRKTMASLCKDVSNNNTLITSALLLDMKKLLEYNDGIARMIPTIENGSEENLRKQVKNIMATQHIQNDILQRVVTTLFMLMEVLFHMMPPRQELN